MRSTSTPTAAQEAGLPSPDELAHAMQPAEFKPAANGYLELELTHGRGAPPCYFEALFFAEKTVDAHVSNSAPN
jgi:hypothetical protein